MRVLREDERWQLFSISGENLQFDIFPFGEWNQTTRLSNAEGFVDPEDCRLDERAES